MKQRYDYDVALSAARSLVDALKPFTERIVIAGSLRRKKPTVGDIEILYIPKVVDEPDGFFDKKRVDVANRELNRMLDAGLLSRRPSKIGVFTWGQSNKLAIHTASGIPTDFFATSEHNWWVSLVIRTGSKETNLRLTSGAQHRGRSLNAYGCGVTELRTQKIIPADSEQKVFELCGVPYLEPHER